MVALSALMLVSAAACDSGSTDDGQGTTPPPSAQYSDPNAQLTTYDNRTYNEYLLGDDAVIENQWPGYGIGDPFIMRYNGVYYLYVSSLDTEVGVRAYKSADLVNWAPVTGSETLRCGALSVDVRLRRVSRDGAEIALTPKEFDILYFLIRNRGEVFTKEQIYRAVWVNDYLMDDSNIMAFIRKLRKKIEPNPDAPEYILTIWGIGYKFNDKL